MEKKFGQLAQLARQLGVSRQRIWQKVKQAEGMCMRCGKPALEGSGLCEKHLLEQRQRQRKLKGCQAWKPGGPGRPPKIRLPEDVPVS